jgi:hypothetical protein
VDDGGTIAMHLFAWSFAEARPSTPPYPPGSNAALLAERRAERRDRLLAMANTGPWGDLGAIIVALETMERDRHS